MASLLTEKFNHLRQHWFVKNVATLQVGSFGGVVVQAVAGIILARMLQPELFGVYSLSIGLAAIAGLLLGAGTQEAVSSMLGAAYAKQDKEEVNKVLAFLIKITICAGILTAGIILILPRVADYFYGNSLIGWYAAVVMAAVFISASFNAVVQLGLQVAGKIRTLTAIIFGDQIFRQGFAVSFVFFGLGISGAVSGHLIGAFLIFTVSIFSWKKLKAEFDIFPSITSLFKQVTKVPVLKYFGFSFWVAVDRNMGNLYMALPIVLTGIFVSTGEVSFFKLAFGYINIAMSLLGPVSILLNIEFPKMKIDDPDKLARNFIKVSMYGLLLSSVLTAGALLVAPIAFRILYGESFLPSVNYVFGLFIYGALFGIGVGLGPMWRAINKVKVSILINTIVLGIGIPLGLFMISRWGIWGSVAMVTLWFTVSHFLSFIYVMKYLKTQKYV